MVFQDNFLFDGTVRENLLYGNEKASEEDMAFANAMIEKYHLLPTAGTDFHGKNRPEVEMGHGIKDNMAVPYHFFENLLPHCRKYILPKGFSAGNGE